MKSAAFLSTFSLILFTKINGQHNGLVYNENFEAKKPLPQQPIRTYTVVQDIMKQNLNTAPIPYIVNEHQIPMQPNTPPSSPCTQQIQLPPDLQQQNLQVQQHLQLQTPPQQLQPIVSTKPLRPQYPIQLQNEATLQSQDISKLQPQTNPMQPILQPQHSLRAQQTLLNQQPLQPLQAPLNLQQTLQSIDTLQGPPLTFQQKMPTLSESKPFYELPVTHLNSINQPNSQIQVKWRTSNPQTVNIETPQKNQNFNNVPQLNSFNHPVEVIRTAEIYSEKPQEVPSLNYYVLPQQSLLPSTSSASLPVSNYETAISSNYVKPVGEPYIPITTPYIMPTSEIPIVVPETTSNINTILASPSILTIPSPPVQSTNTQSYYYNQPGTDSKQNSYYNLNSVVRYPEQPQLSIAALQSPPIPLLSSLASSIPITVVKVPSVSSQYAVSSGYPLNSIVTPAYTNYRPKSSNLKSILPIILKLLKEKIASCGCNDDCSCDCKNNKSDNKIDVATECASEIDYSPFNKDGLAVLNSITEEAIGPECVRETKNSEKIKNGSPEVSNETLEDDFDDEEDAEEDEED